MIMDKRSSRDLLSDLPLSIIHCILERVLIRDAVKTSILSRQWRYNWATLPHLVFDDKCASSSGENGSDETRLCHFINQALFLHKGPVHKFELRVSFIETLDYMDQWLIFLSRNDIRMLILDVDDDGMGFFVHSSLYSCQNLSHLELFRCDLPAPPPTFKGFLRLRCLSLHFVDMSSSTFESLVAPNLKYFYLEGGWPELCLNAPLLAEMSVVQCFKYPDDPLQQKTSVCNYTNFFGGITELQQLEGDCSFIKFLSIGFESCHSSLVLHHLRDIDLFDVSFHDIEVTSVVVRLITDAPNLQKLKISSMFNHPPASEVPTVSFWDSESTPSFTFERLKVIEMEFIRGVLDEMKFIKFLLASSPVLEKMICEPNPCLTDKELLNLTAELLRYRRASSNAEILFCKA